MTRDSHRGDDIGVSGTAVSGTGGASSGHPETTARRSQNESFDAPTDRSAATRPDDGAALLPDVANHTYATQTAASRAEKVAPRSAAENAAAGEEATALSSAEETAARTAEPTGAASVAATAGGSRGGATDGSVVQRADSPAERTAAAPGAETPGGSGDVPTPVSGPEAAIVSEEPAAHGPGEHTAAASAEETVGREGEAESATGYRFVAEVRANALAMAAIEAQQLRLVAQLADEVESDARAMLASNPRVPGAPKDHEVIESAVVGELQAVLGIAQSPAVRLVNLAQRLTRVLPEVLTALESGRLDLIRARVLAEATEVLPGGAARDVAHQMLAVAGDSPWQGLSPRTWRARTDRTVVRVDADAARRRRKEAYERRAVRSWPTSEGMAELFITADAADIAMALQVLTDLAQTRPATGTDGVHVSMDARRVDSFMDVFRRIRDGQALPGVPVRRERELGLVLHADTFFGDGPAANDPGEVRGLSGPSPLDPATAREHAHALVGRVAGTSCETDSEASKSNVSGPGADAVGDTSTDMVDRFVRNPFTDNAADRPNDTVGATSRGATGGGMPGGGMTGGGMPGGGMPGGADAVTSVTSGAVNVLLVDSAGVLKRVVRLARAPAGGWTRQLLDAAITARLDELPPLSSDGYVATAAIEQHVRARNPRCTGYDCPRGARACDLDHDTPWPRGPTNVANLAPRCRRQHEHKTRGLVRTTLHADGSVDTVMLTGLLTTTRPEPLPGHAPGEGYACEADVGSA
jgi:Domain of unknown function (DUF222)